MLEMVPTDHLDVGSCRYGSQVLHEVFGGWSITPRSKSAYNPAPYAERARICISPTYIFVLASYKRVNMEVIFLKYEGL